MATPEAELQNIFNRLESDGATSVSSIKDWLSDGGRRNRGSYTNIANQFAEPFGVRQQVQEATTYGDVDSIRNSSRLMVIQDPRTLSMVDTLVARADRSLALEQEAQATAELEELKKLRTQAEGLDFEQNRVINVIESQIATAREVERQEQELAQRIAEEERQRVEQLKIEFKEEQDLEERAERAAELQEEDARALAQTLRREREAEERAQAETEE